MDLRADRAVVAFVASLHGGYLRFFREYADADCFIFGEALIAAYPELVRHLPGAAPRDTQRMLQALSIFRSVHVIEPSGIGGLAAYEGIILPDEQVSRAFAADYLAGCPVAFDNTWRLRWEWESTQKSQPVDSVRSTSVHSHQQFMRRAVTCAQMSPDWWRNVGAVLVRDGNVVLEAYNDHLPNEQSAYVEGDPRSSFEPGKCIDRTLALHAEMSILAEAARQGISTSGCDLYVSTFPCPPCANALAKSGIRRLFFQDGYSLVAGLASLQSRGISVVRVSL